MTDLSFSNSTYSVMFQMIFFEAYRNGQSYRQVGEKSEQFIGHGSGMSKREAVRNFVNSWEKNIFFK